MKEADPIQLLEDALHLLRRAPRGTLLYHWIGSVPFAMLFLRFWIDATRPRTPSAQILLDALGLALLLAWMNAWRSVYAGKLRLLLNGSAETPWTARRIGRLIAVQWFLGATRLLVLPFAIFVLFPLAATVDFYRSASVLSVRDDLDPLQVIARARALTRLEARQSWLLLPLLLLLALAVFVNTAIGLAILPMLVRMLTGYESIFSRSGQYFVLNGLFGMLALTVSWLAFDPFVQAVYCVRCFRGESLETGEDLRAALRRAVRPVAAAAVIALALFPFAARSSAAVAANDLKPAVENAMQSHEYDWRLPAEAAGEGHRPWIVTATDHFLRSLRSVFRVIGDWMGGFVRWLMGKLENLLPEPQGGALPTRGMHWSMYLLIFAVGALLGFLLWRYRRLRRQKSKTARAVTFAAIRLDAEDLSADRLPEESWLELAEKCLREQNLRLALRAFYLANLAWLGRRQLLTINAGKTNHEYEIELVRRTRSTPAARGLFAANIAAFERAWYGQHDVSSGDIGDFRHRLGQMKTMLAAPEPVA